jgi:hypothetical protein
MFRRRRNSPLISRPNIVVVAVLAITVPLIMLVASRWPYSYDDSFNFSEVNIVHVQRNGTERRQSALFVWRDGTFFQQDDKFGFLALSSDCKQETGYLPSEFSLERAKSVISVAEEQSRSHQRARNTGDWYIKARIGKGYKCSVFTDEDAGSPTFAPVIVWFNGVQSSSATQKRFVANRCATEDPDYVEEWCKNVD